jgi:hypothetical protein
VRPGAAGVGAANGLWLEWERAGGVSRLPLDRPRTIGRDDTCDVWLQEPVVSRHHAVVTIVGGRVHIDASTSTNGIKLPEGHTTKATLDVGQAFRIGSVTFKVVEGPAPRVAAGSVAPAPVVMPVAAPPPAPQPIAPVVPHWELEAEPRRGGIPTIAIGAVLVVILAIVLIGSIVGLAVLHPGPTATASPAPVTNPALAHAPQKVDVTAPPWDSVAAASGDTSNWGHSYVKPEGFSIRYPAEWTAVASPAGSTYNWVSFYPTGSDPSLPSAKITFFFRPDRTYAQLNSNIHTLGRDGYQIERPEGIAGSSALFEIDLPFNGDAGTLVITIDQDLSLKSVLKAMLATGVWVK